MGFSSKSSPPKHNNLHLSFLSTRMKKTDLQKKKNHKLARKERNKETIFPPP